MRILYASHDRHYDEVLRVFGRRQIPGTLERARTSDELLASLARDRRFDAVIVDIDLPPRGGLPAIRAISSDRYPAPVVGTSARADRDAAAAAAAAGAIDFVVRRPGYAEAMPRILREAIETYRLHAEARDLARRKDELDALLNLQRHLCEGVEPGQAYEVLARVLQTACPYDRLVVWRIDPDGATRVAFIGGEPLGLSLGVQQLPSGSLVADVIRERQAMLRGRFPSHPAGDEPDLRAAAPLVEDGQIVGAIEVASYDMTYDEGHLRFLAAAAEQISAALGLATRQRLEEEQRLRRVHVQLAREMGMSISQGLVQPLTVMLGYLELLRSPDISASVADHFWTRVDAAARDLTRRLQQLATIDEDVDPPRS